MRTLMAGASPGRSQRECPPRGPEAATRWSRYIPSFWSENTSRKALEAVGLIEMMRLTTCSRVKRDDDELHSSGSEVRPKALDGCMGPPIAALSIGRREWTIGR